ncbi:MAG: DASS family sodium-coupled anion symporter [Gemmatimonadales bacterium]|nr:DASS family sodium-coupled anion symporter [Gemmatimonadales bacterium]
MTPARGAGPTAGVSTVDLTRARAAKVRRRADWKRACFILLGLALFVAVYFAPAPEPALDPQGESFALTREGKAALALFFLAATWWVTEVIPIGVTAIAIGVVQALLLIRPARDAFTDFMDPSVWFIFGSLVFGMVFTKTGLTRRMAYKMLSLVGERTSMIYLGCFVMTASLTVIMAHTAVAATVFPLFLAIYALYSEESAPTRFGKGLFMGMAFVAGAGSIITLLGAARGAVAIGFFRDITGRQISFFELSYYMLPVGALMTILLWAFFMLYYPPEQKTIPGLRERVQRLYARLGPISGKEILALAIVATTIAVLSLRSFVPPLEPLDKSAIILVATVLFFLFRVVSLEDLEGTSWNIILLFGGAMSIGLCLWQTGAAQWLAVKWLGMFHDAHWLLFVVGVAGFVLVMTNLIMNVAAIAITMPVALVIASYVGVAPEVVLFASLVTAGMPFLLLVGAAPNAIAYASRQFTAGEFFRAGIPASLLLIAVVALFVWLLWPAMGMPVAH